MKILKLTKGIYHIRCESSKELGMAFLRLQEYYESVKFKGKIFSIEEFKKWWVRNTKLGRKSGKFIYCQYFDGFNIPSRVLEPFYKGKFNPLTKWEKQILAQLKKIKEKKFYIIGTRKSTKPDILKHEIAHSFYHSFPKYKTRVNRAMKKLDRKSRKKLDKFLKQTAYHPSVIKDERHAYLLSGKESIKDAGLSIRQVEPVFSKLKQVFSETARAVI